MAQRVIITAGWLAAAVLAVLVGLVAIRLIGDGITSPAAEPMSRSEVERELAAAPPPAPPSPAPSSSAPASEAPGTGGDSRAMLTPGGTVVGRCTAAGVEIVSMSPALGYNVHERETGVSDDSAEGEFRRLDDNQDRVKVEVFCDPAGRPDISVVSERDDDD